MREGGGHHELTNNRSKESDRCQNGWIYVVCSASKIGKNCAITNVRLSQFIRSAKISNALTLADAILTK